MLKIYLKLKVAVSTSDKYLPYQRDPETLARAIAVPGTKGLEHRIGGLEKNEQGGVSYDPQNHERMVKVRAKKVEQIAQKLPPTEVFGELEGDLLVIGWGGTYGSIISSVKALQEQGHKVSSLHLRYLNPFPLDLEGIMKSFKR